MTCHGLSLQSCLPVDSHFFSPIEILLSQATTSGIPQTQRDHVPATNLLRSDVQIKMHAPHPFSCPSELWTTSVLQLPAPSITPWHRAVCLETSCWQSANSIKHGLLYCTSMDPAALSGLKPWGFLVRELKNPVREWPGRKKSPPGLGSQSLAIWSRSHISFLIINKLINYTRNQRWHSRKLYFLLPL